MPYLLLLLVATVVSSLSRPGLSQTLVQTGRYTGVYAIPTDAQRDPLQAIVTIEFPEDIQTVGQAVHFALSDTGYTLTDVLYWDVEIFDLVELPLPAVQRSLGPLTVLDLLKILVGPAFEVIVDPVYRRVELTLAADANSAKSAAEPAEQR